MRDPSKTIYVFLLSVILVAGCLNSDGSGDSSSSADTNGPAVDAYILEQSPQYHDSSGNLIEIDLEVYHAMLDWNGSIEYAGWDVDLDGIVDYEVTSPNGITSIEVDDDDTVLYEDMYIFSIAFGAKDSDGNWGWNMISSGDETTLGQPESSGTLNVYNADDAQAVTSDGGGDVLMKLSFSYAEDELEWAFVDIKIGVGDNVFDCGFETDDDCQIGEQVDDGVWGANEHITLSEGAANIVGAGGEEVSLFINYQNAQVSGDSDVPVA